MKNPKNLPAVLDIQTKSSGEVRDDLLIVQKWSWKSVTVIFSVYTVYLLICILQNYLNYTWRGTSPDDWLKDIEYIIVFSYTWALFTPALFIFGNRFFISRKHLIRNVFFHILFGILLVCIHRLITLSFAHFVLGEELRMGNTFTSRGSYMLHHITDGLFTYIFIVAIYQAFLYFRQSQDREFRLQQAELQTLKMQLQPHFLFNTLNAISALIFIAPKNASKTIGELSDLLRLALTSGKTQEVTLKDELDFLRKYVQIQKTLLQERLEVNFSIDSDTLDSMIPNMILQPLVENSIKHGIAPKTKGGKIEVISQRDGENLRLVIKDNGLGFNSNNRKSDTGIGLENTRMRLHYLYGDSHEINFSETDDGGGTIVTLRIPYREQIYEKVN